MATKPWKPPTKLTVTGKDPAYAYRWIHVDNLDSALENWEVVKSQSKERLQSVTLSDGTPIDGVIKRGNLILCRMPKELAEQRNKYYQAQTSKLLESSVEHYKNSISQYSANRSGGAYGSIVIK